MSSPSDAPLDVMEALGLRVQLSFPEFLATSPQPPTDDSADPPATPQG